MHVVKPHCSTIYTRIHDPGLPCWITQLSSLHQARASSTEESHFLLALNSLERVHQMSAPARDGYCGNPYEHKETVSLSELFSYRILIHIAYCVRNKQITGNTLTRKRPSIVIKISNPWNIVHASCLDGQEILGSRKYHYRVHIIRCRRSWTKRIQSTPSCHSCLIWH
jgi:hypothetical protein